MSFSLSIFLSFYLSVCSSGSAKSLLHQMSQETKRGYQKSPTPEKKLSGEDSDCNFMETVLMSFVKQSIRQRENKNKERNKIIEMCNFSNLKIGNLPSAIKRLTSKLI